MTVSVIDKEKVFTYVDFFSNLIEPLIDTYLVTLVAITQICGKNLVLKHSKLVKELHNCIKVLHVKGIAPNPISCVVEIIETAVFRYVQMELLVNQLLINIIPLHFLSLDQRVVVVVVQKHK